jgi:hypothetical protein
VADVQSHILDPSDTPAAPDANGDGAVNVLDLQRLSAHAGEQPNVPEDDSGELPPATPAAGTFCMHLAAVSTAPPSYEIVAALSSAPRAALADAAPPTTRFHRYSRVPHGPPALRLA